MNRDQILNEAKKIINGKREQDYGSAYNNHKRIADGWTIILRECYGLKGNIEPSHVALMMDWIKTCRLMNGIDHEDSWVDKAGYTALGAEFADKKEQLIG